MNKEIKSMRPNGVKGKQLGGLLAISISILLLLYLLKGLDWASVYTVLSSANISPLILWCLVFLVGTLIRALRWRLLLNSDCKFMDLFDSLNIGNFCNMVLPLRAGEFIRPYLWGKFSGETFSRGFASVVLERVFDVSGLFFVFLVFVPSTASIPELLKIGARGLGGVAIVIAIASLICYLSPGKSRQLLSKLCNLSFVPDFIGKKAQSMGEELIVGLSNIKSLATLVLILVLTCLIWMTYLVGFYLVLSSLDPSSSNLVKAGIICVFISLCVAAPSAPGFIGTFQLGCKLSLVGVFAYSEEFSIAYSIIGHFLQFAGVLSLGFLSLLLRGLNLGSLKAESSKSLNPSLAQ